MGLGVCVVGEVGVRVSSASVAWFPRRRPRHLRQEKERAEWGDAWQDTGKVFTKEDGARLHPETVSETFRRILATTDLPPITLTSDTCTSLLPALDRRITEKAAKLIRGPRAHPLTHRARKVPKSKQRPSQPKPTRALRSRSEGFYPLPAAVDPVGLEPTTNGLKVHCSAN